MAFITYFLVISYCCFVKASIGRDDSLEDAKNNNIMDVTDFSVYYDPVTNETIRQMLPRPWYRPGWMLRLPFVGGPCTCEGLECMCCAGIRIQNVGFDRKACTKLTFEPSEATLQMNVTMNGESIYTREVSAKNPPPFCVPIPVPYLPPGFVDMCVRFFDVSVVDQRLHVCMDWDTRIDMAPVLVLHFDCMDMGFSGIGLSKPGGMQVETDSANDTQSVGEQVELQMDSDTYDSVTENVKSTSQYPFTNIRKYI